MRAVLIRATGVTHVMLDWANWTGCGMTLNHADGRTSVLAGDDTVDCMACLASQEAVDKALVDALAASHDD